MPTPVAIVTAASSGMGASCARELAARGYELVLLARSKSVEALAAELGAVAVRGDVTDPTDLQGAVSTALKRFGRIDGVVNNTGHAAKGELLELADRDWHTGVDLLLLNVIRMTRLVTPTMIKQGSGALVNISTFGAREPSLDFPVSSTIRAALSAFTKLFTEGYAAQGIRMNNILPGYIDSYPVERATELQIPMQRSGRVEEIAKTAAFLISEESSYISGQNLSVDGGLTRSL